MFLMLALVVLFIAGLVFLTMRNIQKGKAMGAKFAPPPAAVTTIVVKAQTWQPVLSAIGTMKAVNGVTVGADLAGVVSEIFFESGTTLRKGELLVRLDNEQEEAQLRSAEAKLALSHQELDRRRDLLAKKAIAQSEWDTAQSQLNQMEAGVAEMKTGVSRKRIAAPFDGVAGIRQVNVGQYLDRGAPIVSLQSMDPIYVDFALPQQHLATLSTGKKLRLSAGGLAGEKFDGEITAIDSQVDASTRNIMIQGTVNNAGHKLRPGMFVEVEVLLPETDGVLAIPSSSIAYAPYGDSIYVVKSGEATGGTAGKHVQQQFVKLGTKRGDQVAVLSGLKEGDEIVSSGVFKLRPGAPVQVDNSVQPGNELLPAPVES